MLIVETLGISSSSPGRSRSMAQHVNGSLTHAPGGGLLFDGRICLRHRLILTSKPGDFGIDMLSFLNNLLLDIAQPG